MSQAEFCAIMDAGVGSLEAAVRAYVADDMASAVFHLEASERAHQVVRDLLVQ